MCEPTYSIQKNERNNRNEDIEFEEVNMDEIELDMRQPVEEAALRMKYDTLEKKKRTIHSCCYCSEEFRFVQKYHEHLESNHGIKTNKRKRYSLGACPLCGKIFMSQENLKLHISTHNEENSFICAVESCAAAFKCSKFLFICTVHVIRLKQLSMQTRLIK